MLIFAGFTKKKKNFDSQLTKKKKTAFFAKKV